MMNEKMESLRMFLGYDSIEDITESTYDENTFDTPDGEYMVLTDEEADEKAKERVSDFIDDCGITGFTPSFQEEIKNNYTDLSWFDEAMRESYEFYIDDIREEFDTDEDGEEVTRLQLEMNEADCEDEESFLDYLCEQENGADWYKSNFGDEAFNEAITKYCNLDVEAICEAVISYDGRGQQLSSYDGEENEQSFEGVTYYIYKN